MGAAVGAAATVSFAAAVGWDRRGGLLAGCLVPMAWAGRGAARDELLRTGERPRAAGPA